MDLFWFSIRSSQSTDSCRVPHQPQAALFAGRRPWLFEGESHVPCFELATLRAGVECKKILGALRQITLPPHAVNQVFTVADLARMLWVKRVVDDVRNLVQHAPPDIEGRERVAVTGNACEVGKVDQHDVGGRPGRLIFDPSAFDHAAERDVGAATGVFQNQ